MARILLIEDEDNIRKIIAYDLKKPILISWSVPMEKRQWSWQ